MKKHRLNDEKRDSILHFLSKKFFGDTPERKAEAKARDAFFASLKRDARKIPKRDLGVFAKYDMIENLDSISPANYLRILESVEEHKVGDKIVKRPKYRSVSLNHNGVPRLQKTWYHYKADASAHHVSSLFEQIASYYVEVPFKKNEKPIQIPEFNGRMPGLKMQKSDDSSAPGSMHENRAAKFISDDTLRLYDAYVLANEAACEVDNKTMIALITMLAAAKFFEEIVEALPEVAEIKDNLYTDLPNNVALITLNDEHKSHLCGQMARRGVEGSVLCAT